MQISRFNIRDVALFTPRVFADDRGNFMETFKADFFEASTGYKVDFVQGNQSFSEKKGTVRGLHYQSPPHAQGKLVRCLAGSIVDVAVDARTESPTYGEHIRVVLSADNAAQLWVPPGFLHGFSTLEDKTIVSYKCTDYYAPECDGNIHFEDPSLGIDWGIEDVEPILSEKDIAAPSFKDFNSPF